MSEILTTATKRPAEAIRVLDWGCGKGQITYLLKQRGFAVTSCDIENQEADDPPLVRKYRSFTSKVSMLFHYATPISFLC